MICSSPRHTCTATTRAGAPCQAHPVPGSDPPRCAAHGGTTQPPGAPQDNQNARTHGAYAAAPQHVDLDARIADLDRRISELSAYIDQIDTGDDETYARLVSLHGQLCSRLGRLLRDRQALGGEAGDLQAAIDEALDLVANALDVEL